MDEPLKLTPPRVKQKPDTQERAYFGDGDFNLHKAFLDAGFFYYLVILDGAEFDIDDGFYIREQFPTDDDDDEQSLICVYWQDYFEISFPKVKKGKNLNLVNFPRFDFLCYAKPRNQAEFDSFIYFLEGIAI